MKKKDWILLFLPIVLNGILLFVFHLLINLKFEKFKRVNNQKRFFFEELEKKIIKAIDMILILETQYNLFWLYSMNDIEFENYISRMNIYIKSFNSLEKFKKDSDELLNVVRNFGYKVDIIKTIYFSHLVKYIDLADKYNINPEYELMINNELKEVYNQFHKLPPQYDNYLILIAQEINDIKTRLELLYIKCIKS